MDEIKKILEEILHEARWRSKQNEKIIELLAKQVKPCGKKTGFDILKALGASPQMKNNPVLSALIAQLEEAEKDGD